MGYSIEIILYILSSSTHSPCNSTPVSAGTPDPEGSSKQLRSFPRSKHKVCMWEVHMYAYVVVLDMECLIIKN